MQLGCLALRRTDPSLRNFVEMILRLFWQRLDSTVDLSAMETNISLPNVCLSMIFLYPRRDMDSFPGNYQSFTRFTQEKDAWNTIIVSFTPAFPAYFAGGVTLPPIIMVQWEMGVSPIWVSFQGNFPLSHDYLEPKWPLFWLEKTLFWRVVSPQNRGQEWFQVWFRKGNPPRVLNHTWNHLGMPLGTVNLPDFFCRFNPLSRLRSCSLLAV